MRAMVLNAYRSLRMMEMEIPVPKAEDVLVRVRAAGICGSDIYGYDGRSGRRIPPLVMGHEAAGTVAEIGAQVTDLAIDQRVTFDSTIFCGRCIFCRRGQTNLCDRREILGVATESFRRHGAFAEYVLVPRRVVHLLPDAISFEQAAMIEPTAIAVHAVSRLRLALGDVAVVIGSGMIGLLAIQALKLAGCSRVLAVDLDDQKLKLARELGADETLDAAQTQVSDEVARLTNGRGADIAVEAVGAEATFASAVASVRKGGQIVLIGNVASRVTMPLQQVVTQEKTLLGACASAGEFPVCIDLLARGAIRVEPMMSAVAPLSQGPAFFNRLHQREPGLMKVILQP